MQLNVALVGNPNSGKTTLFNALTGANQYVGNWPGVTVEKKSGKLRGYDDVTIVDLPGIYSLSPYTLEEAVARNYLIDERPQAFLNIIDGNNLERNLYLSTQAVELGIPMVIVVNMMDVVEKAGDSIDLDALSRKMGCPVVGVSALKGTGIGQAARAVVGLAQSGHVPDRVHRFSDNVEGALSAIEARLAGSAPQDVQRFFAVKLFERDSKISAHLKAAPFVEDVIVSVEKAEEDDAESIIANERYSYITGIIDSCCTKTGRNREPISDRIDRVVTNRWAALPIFAVVMFLVYFISVTTVGAWATGWANDGVFGDGWFFGPGQEEYSEAAEPYDLAQNETEGFQAAAIAAGLDPESASFLEDAESAGIVADVDNYDDATGENEVVSVDVDAYAEALDVEQPDPSDYGIWVPGIPVFLGDAMQAGGVDEQVQSLVLDGIVAGVGSVLGFVPQLLVLFFFLAFLEGCGYMSRIAFILDRLFRRFGLSGKSFVPMLIGTGCGVPGIMASRTIENEADRRMTVMTTTFMPCSAKLPIIALLAGAVFGGAWWVAPSAYFLGIASILCSGIILKKTKAFAGKTAPFVMELPAYHWPTLGSIMRSMGERASSFIKKAGTVILLAAIVIWFISGYGFVDGSFGVVQDGNQSLLALLGGALAWVFYPLGWADWQAVSATVTGLIAKENVVNTFGILYAGGQGWFANVQAAYTPLVGYSFLAFNLLCAPCFAAMGAIKREMASPAWFWRAVGYECGFAYCVALVIYQVGGLITGEVPFSAFTVAALAVVAGFLYLLFRPARHEDGVVRLAVNAVDPA
jgi:ferrous iron transport protein B